MCVCVRKDMYERVCVLACFHLSWALMYHTTVSIHTADVLVFASVLTLASLSHHDEVPSCLIRLA